MVQTVSSYLQTYETDETVVKLVPSFEPIVSGAEDVDNCSSTKNENSASPNQNTNVLQYER